MIVVNSFDLSQNMNIFFDKCTTLLANIQRIIQYQYSFIKLYIINATFNSDAFKYLVIGVIHFINASSTIISYWELSFY